ncbi:hypothetical protein FRC10_003967, partial [Ceratobasidium sp. 414]
MITLIHWIKTNLRMRHLKSGTWLGGPAGVRWIIALFFHLVCALTHLDKKRGVPSEIARHFSTEAHEQHWHMVKTTIKWLRAELQPMCDRLRETYNDRAEAWKEQVKCVYLAEHPFPSGAMVRGVPLVRAETYAVPIDEAALHSCYQYVLQVAPALTPEQDRASTPVERSFENITIPDFNSSSSASSASEPSESADEFEALAEQTSADLRFPTTPP